MRNFLKTFYLFGLICFFCDSDNFLQAQNLVKNPSFELYTQCPTGGGVHCNLVDWYCLNTVAYNTCAPPYSYNGAPNSSAAHQMPKTGNGYAHIMTYSYDFYPDVRGYVAGELTQKLLKDQLYCVSYYLSLTENSGGAIKNVDAYFSDTLVTWDPVEYGMVMKNIDPQIKSTQMLNDSINWLRVNGIYKAKGGEKYLLVGNFLPDNKTTVLNFSSGNPIQVYYFIDDVSVVPLNLTSPLLGNDTSICKNTLPYLLKAPFGYDSYEWSNGDTTNSIPVYAPGEYWVKCTLDSCGSVSDTVQISFVENPELDLGNDTVICKGNMLNLSAQPGFGSYRWNTSETSRNIQVKKSGSYIVNATDQCGIQSDTISVKFDSVPDIKINIGEDTTLCYLGKNFPLNLSSNVPLPNYNWNTGATTETLKVNAKGTYWLESHFLCGSIRSNEVSITECPPDTIELYIPNSFTPNDDGLNDVFRAVPHNLTILELKIFNRWGEMIYEAEKPFIWDGTSYGTPCSSGIYVYIFRYIDKNGNHGQKSGTVNLMMQTF